MYRSLGPKGNLPLRVLIFGKSGQVSRELSRLAWPEQMEVVQLGRDACDFCDPTTVASAVERLAPDVVINAAAYTAVDRAESEPELAMTVNGDAPREMARVCDRVGAALVHISTDYVFDGSKPGAYVEGDETHPASIYGRTKEAGEAGIRAVLARHVIVRTSWVFAGHGANFVKTMLRLGAERPELRVVADQHGAPTSARDIALALRDIVVARSEGRGAWGTFHFTSAEPTTWYGFARAILDGAGFVPVPKLSPITTAEYPTPAVRPANSVLDCTRIHREFGIPQPSWRVALSEVLAEINLGQPAARG
ncbi:MAG: dTDP-4-dehydrorhamnose reductase [Rhizomicrobium sp.]|jgi:dTDP-4-dehydrorhamnose reductase